MNGNWKGNGPGNGPGSARPNPFAEEPGHSDPFETYDAAYVLGALSPADRSAFEEHLRGCDACAHSVRELAGMPGLLGQATPEAVAAVVGEPPPAQLLPELLNRVARARRRRLVTAAAVALAACLVLVLTLLLPGPSDDGGAPGTGTETQAGPGTVAEMTRLGAFPVSADVSLARSAVGTQVEMECFYQGDRAGGYVLVAIGRDGRTEELARWNALPNDEARLMVSTPLRLDEIGSLEVRLTDGTPVLRLPVAG